MGVVADIQDPVQLFQGDQGALHGHAAADEAGSRTGDGQLDSSLPHFLDNGTELGLIGGEKKIVDRPRRQLGFIAQVKGKLALYVREPFYATN
jgi:hypothetical protein